MRVTLLPMLWSGCVAEVRNSMFESADFSAAAPASGSESFAPDTVRVDVFPSTTQDSDGNYRALPQTALVIDRAEIGDSLGELRTAAPVELQGSVSGVVITPWRDAALPGTEGPVDALLTWRRDDAIQSSLAGTDANGAFSTWVIPSGGRYTLAVVPTDPLLPPLVSFELVTTSPDPVDIELGQGFALWGQIALDGQSPEGMRVRAVESIGIATAEAEADAEGWYQLRVPPGSWSVECLGRSHGLDPVLTADAVQVSTDGARVDFDYGALAAVSVRGRVTAGGVNLDLATVRFQSTALPGLANASLEVDAVTVDGNVNVTLAPGTYSMEVHPNAAGPAWTPVRIEAVSITEGSALPSVDLTPAVETTMAVVRLDGGEPLPDASVTCVEVGFGERMFHAETDSDGLAALSLPGVPLDCTVLAADDAGLPMYRDPALVPAEAVAVRLPEGRFIEALVLLDGVPEPYAVVELRDGEDDSLIGAAVTDDNGSLTLLVP